ncbi:MAG TPA: sensor histidine kinase [Solirubrobacteraceae bacterium]
MGQHGTAGHTKGCFHHATLFYTGEDGFIDGTMPFISEAVAAEEPILIAVSGSRIELLKDIIGGSAEQVHFTDMHVLGSNPARIIPAWRRFLADHAPDGRPVRGIGEPIWAGRSEAELTECQRHEALLNVAFDDGQAWQLLCPYDLNALDDDVIEAARRSHPFLAQGGATSISDAYLHGHETAGPFNGELPAPSGPCQELTFTIDQLGTVRWFVAQIAAEVSLEPSRTEDLVLAVNELATNSLRHGGGSGTLRMWRQDGTLLCEVHDGGHITEPLVGRDPPRPAQPSGRGLWIVNHLCDLAQIRSTHTGTVVRVHMHLP